MKIDGEAEGPASEDNCVVCGEWPEAEWAYLRWFIANIPVEDLDQICDGCLGAFWDRLGWAA